MSYLEAVIADIKCSQELSYVRLRTVMTMRQQQEVFQYEVLQENHITTVIITRAFTDHT